MFDTPIIILIVPMIQRLCITIKNRHDEELFQVSSTFYETTIRKIYTEKGLN